MKKVFKIILPILLAAVLVLGLFWYLFVYDRAFTRDVLLYSARFCDRNNRPAIAAWFYDLAYNQSVDSHEVAIELATQHKTGGNFTQAEVILSQAIEDGGSVELYAALSRIYVEQDKILDAVKLLDSITNPQVLEELQTMRPAAPTATPEPGFYNQYMPITITGDGGTLFVNPNGEYPSIMDKPHTEPVVLHDGENSIYAVTVADNGLVSPLSVFSYTVGGIIEEVSFADSAVEATVRSILGVDSDTVLMSNQLWDITSLSLPVEATNFADLKYMPFLTDLVITSGPSGQLEILSSLTNLVSLNITNTPVSESELQNIGQLTGLKSLTLCNCGISTVEPLRDLTSLQYLDLSNNTIRNIQPLSGMTGLTQANLSHNALTDLSALGVFKALTRLDVSYNNLTTLSPICELSVLTWLDANHNSLTEVLDVGQLTALQYLSVAYNTLTDISSLATCTSLTSLDISNNQLSSLDAAASLTNLETLNFSHNEVREMPDFAKDCALVTVDGSHNKLESLAKLSGLESLNNVYMDYNEQVQFVKCLADCPNLIIVNVYGTRVTEVKMLTDQSIIVNFDPTQADSLI